MPSSVEERAQALRDSQKTLHLATVGADGTPTASYAPFVRIGADFYIYVSEMSRHTNNLTESKKASILLIEDEDVSTNLLARKRITFSCNTEVIKRESDIWHIVIDCFRNSFGEIFEAVIPLTDFALFRLTPHGALYVEGFGQAYRIDPELLNASHIHEGGHITKRFS